MTRIAFIGAGSTVFMRSIVGDALQRAPLADAAIALMDVDARRLAQSEGVARGLAAATGGRARVEAHGALGPALDGADFVVVAFQIGGYDPATITDFEVPRRHGLRQTIGDTLGVGGIMRGLRTVPHLWALAAEMERRCPGALLLQYVNPMAINTWALAARHPDVRQVGLCHSVQGTAAELARDLGLTPGEVRYRAGGINHMSFFLELAGPGGDLYPALRAGYRSGRLPAHTGANARCHNRVRYEVMEHLGYFVTESSEHFAEYVPWFIKSHRPDLIKAFGIPLDEYPRRCVEQAAEWEANAGAILAAPPAHSLEYAAAIMEAEAGGAPALAYGNVPNHGLIPQLPEGCAVEVPCRFGADGMRPEPVTGIPPQLIALMRTNVNVQELTVRALLDEDRDHVYHAAMMDPRTAAELDLRQIRALVDELIAAHGELMPEWLRGRRAA